MSFNLIDAAKGLFTSELVSKASSYLGESESGVSKALSGILPSVIGGIADRASSNEGANAISNLAKEHHGGGILDNIGNFFGAEGGGLFNKAAGALGGLFGDSKVGMLTSLVSNFSGIKSSAATSLLSMAAPAVLGMIGKHASDNNLDAGGLASMLAGQKANIAAAVPQGFNLGSVFSGFGGDTAKVVSAVTGSAKSAGAAATHYAGEAAEKTGGAMKFLLPLLLLALAAMAVLYFWKGCGKTDAAGGHSADAHKAGENTGGAVDKPADNKTVALPAGKLDSIGEFVYDLGETVKFTLPNGGGELTVGKNSTEAKLITFLNDKNAAVDTVKGNWFDFTNVRFKTNSSEITAESMAQLTNMVAISKAYPTAQFKIGGYTDNTGAADKNKALSQKRADAVAAKIKSMGAAAASIVGAEGYGPEHPIGDNATAEGRAMNRRVSVRVKAK